MFPHEFNELAALVLLGMVEPTASIDDVIFLNDSKSAAIGRGMRKDENLPSVVGVVRFQQVFKPVNLFLIDDDFMGGKGSVPKDRRPQSDEQRFLGDLATELRRRLAMAFHKDFQVFFIGGKLINPLQVMIPPDDFIGDRSPSKAAQKFGGHLVTKCGPRKEFGRIGGIVIAIFGFSHISQTNHTGVAMCFLGSIENGFPMGLAHFVFIQLTRVNVEIAQNSHQEARLVKASLGIGTLDGGIQPFFRVFQGTAVRGRSKEPSGDFQCTACS